MNKRNNKSSSSKSSGSSRKAAFKGNYAANRALRNSRASTRKMDLTELQRRRGSMPDMHKSLVSKIAEEKSLRAVGRMALDVGTQAVLGHGAPVVASLMPRAWELVASRLMTHTQQPPAYRPTGSGFRPTSIQEFVHPPVQRNLVDNKTYYTKIDLREGETSKMLKAAKKLYPSSSHNFWDTGSDYCADMIYQCHGINQTGFWQPYTYNSGVANAPTTYNQVNKFTVVSRDIYKFLQQSLTSTELTDANAMKGNEDLLFNIESATNKMVVRNASELTPCICTAYIINAKVLSAEGVYPVKAATLDTDFPAGFITSPTSRTLHTYQNSTGVDTTQIYIDVAARLGFTPQMSNVFNDVWEVVDVVKSPVLNPGDQWNFTLKQHFSHPTSYQALNYLYGDTPNFDKGQYTAGDYEIILQFQGAAGFANNVSAGPHDYNIRFSTNSNPCMITCTQSRSIQYRFPDSLGSTVRDSDRFVSDVVRELDTSPRVSPYFGSGNYEFRAVAMTQTESREANKEGIGRKMDDD